ncbi:MAG: hypothetical protein CW342_03200 [Thermoactinomycetaceae bacterium]|nr:hypothetical protein [Bacillota bacterium]MBO2531897.1 hypothetical protein [Thermoactinomycetaceae bacterium]
MSFMGYPPTPLDRPRIGFKVTTLKEVLCVSGYGYGGYGIGLRRLLIFLLVIATIFVFAGVGFGY